VLGALAVDVDGRAQQPEIVAERGRGVDERVAVLREAAPAVAEARLEERVTDAGIEADRLDDLGDVGAGQLTDVGDRVDEGDLGREETRWTRT